MDAQTRSGQESDPMLMSIRKFFKTFFGADQQLLDHLLERTKKMEATVDGEDQWMLVCRPISIAEKKESEIVCNNDKTYEEKNKEKKYG